MKLNYTKIEKLEKTANNMQRRAIPYGEVDAWVIAFNSDQDVEPGIKRVDYFLRLYALGKAYEENFKRGVYEHLGCGDFIKMREHLYKESKGYPVDEEVCGNLKKGTVSLVEAYCSMVPDGNVNLLSFIRTCFVAAGY